MLCMTKDLCDSELWDRVNRVMQILECVPNIIDDLNSLHFICIDLLSEVKGCLESESYELE